MQLRKIQEMGGATLLVSLPKEWTRSVSVHKGSVVSIENSGDGGLLIYAVNESENRSEKEIEIQYPSKYTNAGIPNEITAAYLLGYDLIRIKGKHRISSTDREEIVQSVKRLIGLEIVEEDAKSITSQFLVDNMAVEPSKILRRISSLVRAMINDTLKQLSSGEQFQSESVAQRDDEVDRLHFLLVRLIRTALRETRAASKFGLSSIDCLDYRVAASSLETAGDYAVELSNAVSQIHHVDAKTRERLTYINEMLDSIQDNAVRGFIDKEFILAQKVLEDYERAEDVISNLRNSKGELQSSTDLLYVVDVLERILRCQRDVADLVSPMVPA